MDIHLYASRIHGSKIELSKNLLLFGALLHGTSMKTLLEIPIWFSKQKTSGKLVIGLVGLLFLFCMCSGMSAIYARLGQPPSITLTYQGADSFSVVTWTPAFSGSPTPTSSITPTSTPVGTRTPLPTELPTRSFETATIVILPTGIDLSTGRGVIIIAGVDKKLEYVDIQNVGHGLMDLSGWVLTSERGNQSCRLNGILQTNEVLRVWTHIGPVGYNCGFLRDIWNDNELDPAVLYNRDGQEVDRYP